MKIFISWAKKQSRLVAEILSTHLKCVIQDLDLFMSDHAMTSGERWTSQLSSELENCEFGIVCLTPENLLNPWIHFEAGALSKHTGGRVCSLLFNGVRPLDVSAPLAQFHNQDWSRKGFTRLMEDINKLCDSSLDASTLQRSIETWWPRLNDLVNDALVPPDADCRRTFADVLEELVIRVRRIQRSVEHPGEVIRPALEPTDPFSQFAQDLDFVVRSETIKLKLLYDVFVGVGGLHNTIPIETLQEYGLTESDIDPLVAAGVLSRTEKGYAVVDVEKFRDLIRIAENPDDLESDEAES